MHPLLVAITGIVLLPTAALGKDFALVIGVNDCPEYQPGENRPMRRLKGAEADAVRWGQWLSEHGYAVRSLLGQQATYAAARRELAELSTATKRADRVLLFFAGHGTQTADQRPFDEPDGADEALCLADCRFDGQNLLLDDEVGRWIDELEASQVTVVLDCCHAGTGIKDLDDEVTPRFLPGCALREGRQLVRGAICGQRVSRSANGLWRFMLVTPINKRMSGELTRRCSVSDAVNFHMHC